MTTADAPERQEPPFTTDERTMLTGWLDYHRATLAWKCSGLDDAQLREKSAPPSSLSLLGLVRHMAEVERGWFRNCLAGEPREVSAPRYYSEDDPDGDFDNVADADVAAAFADWEAECAHARELVAAHASLDDLGVTPRHRGQVSLRWILTHMVEEYARHNGHADLLRERIDGAVGD